MLSIEPEMRMADTMEEPSHQVAHIHHAHWFTLDPGNEEDNYTAGYTEWIFGNGDEETKADFQERSAAEPNGPDLRQYIDAAEPAADDLHAAQQDRQRFHRLHRARRHLHPRLAGGAPGGRPGGREYHDISGVLFGRTFDVPRDASSKDGTFEQPEDDKRGCIEWTSTVDGTMIGTGSHLHPGGERVIIENYGSEESPCPDAGKGYGGTVLLKSDVL